MPKAVYGLTKDFIFQDAVKFLRQKEPLSAEEYNQISDAAKAKAFTVAGYTQAEILQTFLTELSDAAENGKTLRDFSDSMNTFLERNGLTGLDPAHARTVFQTNMQTAYNAGHYKSMQEAKKLRPYWEYVTAGDGHVRAAHAQMHGRIYACDDPVWNIWYPPNGFNCRCTVVSRTQSYVDRNEREVSRQLPHTVDYDTGEILYSYPDKGFSNNPAKDTWKPDTKKMDPAIRKIYADREKGK